MTEMTLKKKRNIGFFIRKISPYLVILGLLAWLINDNPEIFQSWEREISYQPSWLVAVFASLLGGIMTKSTRFYLLYRFSLNPSPVHPSPVCSQKKQAGKVLPLRRPRSHMVNLFSLFVFSYSASYFFLGAGIALKTMVLRVKYHFLPSKLLGLVAVEKIISLLVILFILLLVGNEQLPARFKNQLQFFSIPLTLWTQIILTTSVILLMIFHRKIALCAYAILRVFSRKLGPKWRKITSKLDRILAQVSGAMKTSFPFHRLIILIFLSSLLWLFEVMFLYSIFSAANSPISLLQAALAVLIIFAVSNLLQIGGGIGTYELGFVIFASSIGFTGNILKIAVGAHSLLFVCQLCFALISFHFSNLAFSDFVKHIKKTKTP